MARKTGDLFLPKAVESWMIYADSGEMRLAAFKHGRYRDHYHGWVISYDPFGRLYSARSGTLRSQGFSRKAEVYKFCRDNTQKEIST